MKKVMIVLSICMIANPLLSAHATMSSKRYKKVRHTHRHILHEAQKAKRPLPPINKKASDTKEKNWLDNMSGYVTFSSNYLFRGISISQNNPATQGSLTYSFPFGLYFNIWGSNTNYTAPDGKTATSEIDTIAGWKGDIKEDFTYDIAFARYNYPGARFANYNELNTGFGYKILRAGLSYSGNYSGTHASGTYYTGGISYDIPPEYIMHISDVNFQAMAGHYRLSKLAGNSYSDYSLTLNKKLSDIYSVSAQWTGTNGRAKNPPFDKNHLVGAITASF